MYPCGIKASILPSTSSPDTTQTRQHPRPSFSLSSDVYATVYSHTLFSPGQAACVAFSTESAKRLGTHGSVCPRRKAANTLHSRAGNGVVASLSRRSLFKRRHGRLTAAGRQKNTGTEIHGRDQCLVISQAVDFIPHCPFSGGKDGDVDMVWGTLLAKVGGCTVGKHVDGDVRALCIGSALDARIRRPHQA